MPIELLNIDCMEYMATCKDNQFDLAIVDPPYGIDFVSKGQIGNSKFISKNWDKAIPNVEYFTELIRVSKNQIIWGANYFDIIWKYYNKGFIYWNKLNHDSKGDGELALTSFDIGNRYFEYMWDGNRYGYPKQGINGVGKPSIRIHPTEKPIALYSWILKTYAKEGNTIFDSHLGSGSIAIACNIMKFDLVGCEIDKDYYDKAKARFELYKSQLTFDF